MWKSITQLFSPRDPVVHTIVPQVTTAELPLHAAVQQPVLLKKLKWITYRGRIGIVWELDKSGYATVHLTNPAGQTVEVIRVNATELKIAKYLEIPDPRRNGLSQVYAATLGYY